MQYITIQINVCVHTYNAKVEKNYLLIKIKYKFEKLKKKKKKNSINQKLKVFYIRGNWSTVVLTRNIENISKIKKNKKNLREHNHNGE